MKARMFWHLPRLVLATAFAAATTTAVLTTIAANAGAPAQGLFAAAPAAAFADADDHRRGGNAGWRDGKRGNWSAHRDDSGRNDNPWRTAGYDRDQRFNRDRDDRFNRGRDDRFNRGNSFGGDGRNRQSREQNWGGRYARDDRFGRNQRWQR